MAHQPGKQGWAWLETGGIYRFGTFGNGAAGYNGVSRHIVYAGGLDRQKRSKDTRTEAQKNALASYVRDFHRRFPDVKIVGHNELDKGKACPSFCVQDWLESIGINQ